MEHQLGYAFSNRALLRVALTLGSWANEHAKACWPSNACLEFFGDAVLGLLAADALWRRFPELSEGDLTRLRASVVTERALVAVAREIELGHYLYLGRGDLKRGARDHDGTLADAVEAVLGAVFLDAREVAASPADAALRVFENLFHHHLAQLEPDQGVDPKSRLQHLVQGKYRLTPVYVRRELKDMDGAPRWYARVELHRECGEIRVLGEGEGSSRKRADQAAAKVALAAETQRS